MTSFVSNIWAHLGLNESKDESICHEFALVFRFLLLIDIQKLDYLVLLSLLKSIEFELECTTINFYFINRY